MHSHRFLVALAIAGGNLCTNALWSKYAAITPSAASYYGVSSFFDIALLSIVFYVLYIPISPIASWAIQKYGMRISIIIGGICNVIAGICGFVPDLVATASPTLRYRIVFVGQIVASLGQSFIFNSTSRASSVWFGASERTLANAVMSLGQPLGSAIVLAVTPTLLGQDRNSTNMNLSSVNLFVMILVMLCSFPCLLLKYRDGPPCTFESTGTLSASISSKRSSFSVSSSSVTEIPNSYWQETKSLFRNRNYLLLWVTFTLAVGVFNIQTSLISDFIVPHGYSEDQAGVLGALSITTGLIFAFAVSPLIDRFNSRSKKHAGNEGLADGPVVKTTAPPILEWLLKGFVWINMASIVLFYLFLSPNQFPWLVVSVVGSGISGFILVPLILELGVESSYPVAEGTSSGYLMIGSQISATIMVFVSDAFRSLPEESGKSGYLPQNSALPMVACMILASISVCFFKNKQLRQRQLQS